jgi:hypothetical protein
LNDQPTFAKVGSNKSYTLDSRKSGRSTIFDEERDMSFRQTGNAKIFVLVGTLVLIAGAIALLGKYHSPDGEGATGTIVPAERYRADQIERDDVVLGDESLAQFMQTDE